MVVAAGAAAVRAAHAAGMPAIAVSAAGAAAAAAAEWERLRPALVVESVAAVPAGLVGLREQSTY